jgi:hypothetical protein
VRHIDVAAEIIWCQSESLKAQPIVRWGPRNKVVKALLAARPAGHCFHTKPLIGRLDMKRLARLMTIVGVSGVVCIGACAIAPTAFAEATYECGSCENVSGPNQSPIGEVWGENLNGTGLCVTLWEFTGGGYREVTHECSTSRINLIISAGQVDGHGDTRVDPSGHNNKLWGWQRP